VAEGQGELRGRIVRTGFLGLHSGKAILFVIKELGSLLLDMGCSVDPDAAGRALEELSDQAEIVW
jgi:aspartate aminotransferase-like enzyme